MKRIIALLLLALLLAGCGGESELVGLWISVDAPDFQLQLDDDGTGFFHGVMSDGEEPMSWFVEDEELCLSGGDGENVCMPYRLDGDHLAIETSTGDMSRFERWTD